MVFRALRKVCPELVPAAEKHAAGITKIGLNGMFESAEVPLGEKPSVQSRGGPSSGGGTRICGRFSGKELHSLQSWGQTGDNFGQREVLMSPPRFQEAGNPIQTPHPLFGVPRI